MAAERLVIVGGDAAGMSAASQARRRRSADDLEIIAFERGPHTSYSACGMPYMVAGMVSPQGLVIRSPEQFDVRDIGARVHHEVISIDTSTRRVTVRDLVARRDFEEPYDHLLIATGTRPVRPPLPGIDLEGIFGLNTLQTGIAVREAVDGWAPKRGVIVGGGYIGLEMAEALLARGVQTSLVEALAQPMLTLDPDMGELVSKALVTAGVDVYRSERVVGFEGSGGRVAKVITERRELEADIVVLGLGTQAQTDLAREAGLRIGASSGIWVDDRCRTSVDGVWAAGDCAEQTHIVTGSPVNFHLGTIANKMGRVCGINIGGGEARFAGVAGTAITRVCDAEVARTGISLAEAEKAGIAVQTSTVRSRTTARYFDESAPMTVKIHVRADDGTLVGTQIVGGPGSGKRIDTAAVAIHAKMTVQDLVDLDLSYAPPFATVWDPIVVAARKLVEG